VVNLVRTCGWKDFVEVVAAASAQTQLRIMGLLPQALQDEISNTTARRKAVLVVQSASAKY
jgi:propanediol utilization protein